MYTIQIYQQIHQARCQVSSLVHPVDLNLAPLTKCLSVSSALSSLSCLFGFSDSTFEEEYIFLSPSGLFQLSLPSVIPYMYCKWWDLPLLLPCS